MTEPFRVLVVEDEFFVASSVAALLETMGCTILGPCFNLRQAQEARRRRSHAARRPSVVTTIPML
jgi:hypothetical protein